MKSLFDIYSTGFSNALKHYSRSVVISVLLCGIVLNVVSLLVTWISTSFESYVVVISSLLGVLLQFVIMALLLASLIGVLHSKKGVKQLLQESTQSLWVLVGIQIIFTILSLLWIIGLVIEVLAPYGSLALVKYVVAAVMLLGVSLLVLFGVYWFAASYRAVLKKTSVRESLASSFALVKNRWWKTFGYILLTVFSLGIPLIVLLGSFTIPIYALLGEESLRAALLEVFLSNIFYAFIVPFAIGLGNAYYLELERVHSANKPKK